MPYTPYTPYTPTWNNPYLQQGMAQQNGGQVAQMGVGGFQMPYDGIVKVNGPESAMQRNLPPNSTSDPMFDLPRMVFYVVSTDGNGAKTMETFDFNPHREEQQPAEVDGTQFVSRAEFDDLAARVNRVNAALEAMDGSDGPDGGKPPATKSRTTRSRNSSGGAGASD